MSQAGIVDVEGSHPQIPTVFVCNVGSAVPIANTLEILGTTVAAHSIPLETLGSGNTVTIEAQYASAAASSVGANAGFASFNSTFFSVDANGYVTFNGSAAIESFMVDAFTAPGTNPVLPNGSGIVTITGGQVAAGTTANVIRTNSLAVNTYTIQIQRSQAVAVSTIGDNGVSHFNSTFFTVDANGFVSLNGSSVGETITGNVGGALSPTLGNWNIFGISTAAGTTPVQTSGSVSTLTVQVQTSQAIASTDATKIGLSNFDSAAFQVDANGFVQLKGGGQATVAFDIQANTAPGTNPVVPTAAGHVTVNGAVVANHSVVLETRSRAANTYNLEVQYATSAASTDGTKSGVAHFDSAFFTVDANGFVSSTATAFTWNDVSGAFSALKNNGYFVTATATGTLPASPSQGDTIKFFVDSASQFLTIQASGSQLIRLGSLVSSAGGTAVSTLQGDSVELVYRASDTQWCAVCGFSGTWIMA
jgi:hypothetical protein